MSATDSSIVKLKADDPHEGRAVEDLSRFVELARAASQLDRPLRARVGARGQVKEVRTT